MKGHGDFAGHRSYINDCRFLFCPVFSLLEYWYEMMAEQRHREAVDLDQVDDLGLRQVAVVVEDVDSDVVD